MHDPDKINPACEHRMTIMETVLGNHIPHVDKRLTRIEKILWGLAVAFVAELVGLLMFLLKGHIYF